MSAQVNQAQINNNSFTNIGRMFARRNVPEVYGFAKAAATADPEAIQEQVDRVSLSPLAPRPLPARLLEEAMDTGRLMNDGKKLPADRVERIREDRVFAAVSALAAIGETGEETGSPRSWPVGLPAPTSEEMEVARRRLAQRLRGVDQAEDPTGVQMGRVELLQRIGRRSFAPAGAGEEVAALAGASA